jgi:hypothetical protein
MLTATGQSPPNDIPQLPHQSNHPIRLSLFLRQQLPQPPVLFPDRPKLRGNLSGVLETQLDQKKGTKRTSPGNSTRCLIPGSGSRAFRLISSKRSGRPRRNLWCENSQVCTSVVVRWARGVCRSKKKKKKKKKKKRVMRCQGHDSKGNATCSIYFMKAVHVELAHKTRKLKGIRNNGRKFIFHTSTASLTKIRERKLTLLCLKCDPRMLRLNSPTFDTTNEVPSSVQDMN